MRRRNLTQKEWMQNVKILFLEKLMSESKNKNTKVRFKSEADRLREKLNRSKTRWQENQQETPMDDHLQR